MDDAEVVKATEEFRRKCRDPSTWFQCPLCFKCIQGGVKFVHHKRSHSEGDEKELELPEIQKTVTRYRPGPKRKKHLLRIPDDEEMKKLAKTQDRFIATEPLGYLSTSPEEIPESIRANSSHARIAHLGYFNGSLNEMLGNLQDTPSVHIEKTEERGENSAGRNDFSSSEEISDLKQNKVYQVAHEQFGEEKAGRLNNSLSSDQPSGTDIAGKGESVPWIFTNQISQDSSISCIESSQSVTEEAQILKCRESAGKQSGTLPSDNPSVAEPCHKNNPLDLHSGKSSTKRPYSPNSSNTPTCSDKQFLYSRSLTCQVSSTTDELDITRVPETKKF